MMNYGLGIIYTREVRDQEEKILTNRLWAFQENPKKYLKTIIMGQRCEEVLILYEGHSGVKMTWNHAARPGLQECQTK